jgi:hypothetical protein
MLSSGSSKPTRRRLALSYDAAAADSLTISTRLMGKRNTPGMYEKQRGRVSDAAGTCMIAVSTNGEFAPCRAQDILSELILGAVTPGRKSFPRTHNSIQL